MAAELNCFQRRNPGAGFVKEHGTLCAFDRSGGIDHGVASKHLNLGGWCGNVCDDCANKTEGSGEKKRPKYRPEQVSEDTFQAVVIVAPRFIVNRSVSLKSKSITTAEENIDMPTTSKKKSGTKKKAARAKRTETEKITDAKALKMLEKAEQEGVSKSYQTLARWFRTKGFAMSVNRIQRIAEGQTAKA